MAEVYLASSALIKEGYDGLRTIVEAKRVGFDGVQLFLDPSYRQGEYLTRVITALSFSTLGLVVHLPNEVNSADIHAAEELVKHYPDTKALIHYLPATKLPKVEGTRVGWENSTIGFDPMHVREVKNAVNRDRTFFAYNLSRQLMLDGGTVTPDTAVMAVKRNIQYLKPRKDIIHVMSMARGICAALLADIRNYPGIVVLEHEDLQMAVASLSALR